MESKAWSLSELRGLRTELTGAYRGPVPSQLAWYGLHNQMCILWLIERGNVRIETEFGEQVFHPDTWIFMMPGLRLNQIFSPDALIVSIRFTVRWPNGRSIFHSRQLQHGELGHFPQLKQAADRYLNALPVSGASINQEDLRMQPDDVWGLFAAESRFYQRWYRCACDLGFEPQAMEVGDPRVASCIDLLKQHLDSRDVPYPALSSLVGRSRAQLDRIFQQVLGHSPKREHDALRLEYAQEQLQYGHRPIKQIANDLGFQDASQFAKWFRRLYGRNPREARNNSGATV